MLFNYCVFSFHLHQILILYENKKPTNFDIVDPTITSDSKQSDVGLPQLDEDLPQTNNIDGLVNAFMNQ